MGDGGELHTIYLTNALNVLHKLGIPWSKMHIEKEMTTNVVVEHGPRGELSGGACKRVGLTPDITVDQTKEFIGFVVEIETEPSNVQIKEQRYEKVNKKVLFIEPTWTLDKGYDHDIMGFINDIQIQLESQIHKVDRKLLRSAKESQYRKEQKERYRKGSRRA